MLLPSRACGFETLIAQFHDGLLKVHTSGNRPQVEAGAWCLSLGRAVPTCTVPLARQLLPLSACASVRGLLSPPFPEEYPALLQGAPRRASHRCTLVPDSFCTKGIHAALGGWKEGMTRAKGLKSGAV